METFDQSKQTAKIRVVGAGGAGCNAVNTMIAANLDRVQFIAANTDIQALAASRAPIKVQMGGMLTKGLGAGANPEIGREAAIESKDAIARELEGADMVFITAGMGGGTGTGAAPVIAEIAKSLGALTVGVVTKPFAFEGNKRRKQAEQGLVELKSAVDTLITIPNQRLLSLSEQPMPLLDTFKRADEVLLNAVQGISDLIQYHGYINVDFADVKTIMSDRGLALMGTGRASGDKRALTAMQQAISSPLLEDVTIDGATGLLINITGGRDMTLQEVNEALTLVHDAADPEAEIIFGSLIDDDASDQVKITIIATGFVQREPKLRPMSVAPALHTTTRAAAHALREEPVAIVPAKSGARNSQPSERAMAPQSRIVGREPALPMDEDQFDIPTFLRRQGQTDLP
ncbi:MAG: cell division protein FtsZ [Myxococcaceae bacterium]